MNSCYMRWFKIELLYVSIVNKIITLCMQSNESMYITGKSVPNFLTLGINSLSFVFYSIIWSRQ